MITRQHFELKGRLLEMAIAWKRDIHDAHIIKVQEVLKKEFGTTRAILSSWIGGEGISAVGDDNAPIEGMAACKKHPGFLAPTKKAEGKDKAAILKGLDYPAPGEPVLAELGVLNKLWSIENKMVSSSFFQVGDRWFVGVPVEKIPAQWFNDSDLTPMQPYEMHRIESSRDSL
jgi:hypothetical protein